MTLPGFEYPRTGVGVMVVRAGKDSPIEVLLGKRKGSHAAGEYAFPGGHLRNGESLVECARREVIEETSLALGNVAYCFTAIIGLYAPDKHYVQIGVISMAVDPHIVPRRMEPEKCEGWDWYGLYDPSALPRPLMGTTALALYEHGVRRGFYDLDEAAKTIRQIRGADR